MKNFHFIIPSDCIKPHHAQHIDWLFALMHILGYFHTLSHFLLVDNTANIITQIWEGNLQYTSKMTILLLPVAAASLTMPNILVDKRIWCLSFVISIPDSIYIWCAILQQMEQLGFGEEIFNIGEKCPYYYYQWLWHHSSCTIHWWNCLLWCLVLVISIPDSIQIWWAIQPINNSCFLGRKYL